jgi:predicted outer membrane repeat protein
MFVPVEKEVIMKGKRALIVLVFSIGVGLLATSVFLLGMAAANGPGLTCSVPDDHSTIQAAVNDLSCDSINVGPGTFDENVTINRTVTIQGQGISSTTVDGRGLGSVFTIPPDVSATLGDMTIANGAADQGGGINNLGLLVLVNSVVTGNEAYDGAGIDNEGIAHVSGSTLSENYAVQGGAIYNHKRMTVISSTLQSNRAKYRGGAILSRGNLTVTNSTVSGNVVETSQPADANGGGGFFLYDVTRFHLTNSTVSSNTAVAGGGIVTFVFERPVITLTNSTLYGNSAEIGGGVRMLVVTPTVSAVNTIIAGNTGGDCLGGTILSRGHNINGDDSCGLAGSGDMNGTDPLLGPLGDHGGPTLTHLPLAGSPAIDAGDDSLCPPTDQRGYARPDHGKVYGIAVCDIGSVEVRPPILEVRVYAPILSK